MSQEQNRKPRKRRGNSTVSALVYVALIVGISLILASVGWILANDVLSLNKTYQSVIVTIDNDPTVSEVADILEENDLIKYKWLFKLYCGVTKSSSKLTAGVYELNTDMDYYALVRNISSKSATRQTTLVTIPEGYELDQIFALLEEKGVSTVEKLEEVAANRDFNFSFLKEIPLGDPHRLEGYLFPDTYEFYYGDSPITVLNKMLLNFDAKFTDEMRAYVAELGYTVRDMVIIASMVERETDGADQKNIASVIYNRLNSDNFPHLQIDATVQYALSERKESLSEADTQIDSPYNTYVVEGLPAGPICSPGIDAINAAIYPNSTNYYYYRVGSDGATHVFARTYEEHLANAS